MTIALFDPQLVIARLGTEVSALKRVAGAADFAAATGELKQVPAAFVMEVGARAAPNALATEAVSQQMEVRFAVVLAAQNLRDARAEAAASDLRALRTAVITALLGWAPDANCDPIEFAAGRLIELDNLVLWWQDEFTTRLLLRSI